MTASRIAEPTFGVAPPERGRRGSWLVALAPALVVVAGVVIDAPQTAELAFPAAAVVAGALLYHSHPEFFVGYVWWLWFLTPLARRLIDWRQGFNETSPVLLAPLLVSALCLVTLIRRAPKMQRISFLPFLFVLPALALAYVVGVFKNGPGAPSYTLLTWLAPAAFGFHLAAYPERYPEHSRITGRAFCWGALVMGLYGVIQFVSPAGWDADWMVGSRMGTIGEPLPYLVRVFSTLNSPSPFGVVMVGALLSLLADRSRVRWAAAAPAVLAIFLSLARTAWVGLVVGLVVYGLSHRLTGKLRVLALTLGIAVVALPGLFVDPVAHVVGQRLGTFTDLSEDLSYQLRMDMYTYVVQNIAQQPLGLGLGAIGAGTLLGVTGGQRNFDSGVLELFVSLGWIGGLLASAGLVALLVLSSRQFEPADEPRAKAARAATWAAVVMMLSLNTMTQVSGAVLWGFGGLALAARTYYR